MKHCILVSCICCFTSLFSINFSKSTPQKPNHFQNTPSSSYSPPTNNHPLINEPEITLIPLLNGLILTDPNASISDADIEHAAGNIEDLNLNIPGSRSQLYKTLRKFLYYPLTTHSLYELKRDILLHYQREGRPIVTIEVPEQKVTNGILNLIIIEGKVGEISAEGNKYFSNDQLENYISLETGESIDSNILTSDLQWINKNPFRHVDIIYSPGNIAGTTDIRLLTTDIRPYQFYTGINNTGYRETDTTRLFFGSSFGNLFNLDQQFSMQFTCARHVYRYWGITGEYTIPLPCRDILSIYGGYSQVRPNLNLINTKNFGYAAQMSLRYHWILPRHKSYLQQITCGSDYKRTNNNVEFGGEQVFISSTNLTQLVIGYTATSQTPTLQQSFDFELFYSPGDWLPQQSNAAYQIARPNAKSSYMYIKCGYTPTLQLPYNSSLSCHLKGQLSTQNLLASEQSSLGGYGSVRGYPETVFAVDNIFLASIECLSPQHIRFSNNKPISFQLLVFLDYGIGNNVHKNPNDLYPPHYLMGIGPGIRMSFFDHLTVNADYGIQLKKTSSKNHTSNHQFNFSIIGNY